jgi:multidrug resistance efflux pump
MSDAVIAGKAKPKSKADARLRTRIAVIVGAAAALAAVVYYFFGPGTGGIAQGTTYIAKKGDLDITVTEGGSVQALESQEIISEIKGNQGVKILSLVEEGYFVSPEDVENKKVLVELDSADLKDRVVNQKMAFQSAESGYVEKKAQYEIQLSQNQSTISTSELTAKFAQMDFEKYLGKKAVASITQRLGLDETAAKLAELKKQGGPKPDIEKPVVALGVAPVGAGEGPGGPRQWQGGSGRGVEGGGERRRRPGAEGENGGPRPQGPQGGFSGAPGAPGASPVADGPAGGALAGPGGPGGQRGEGGSGGPGGPGGGQRMDPERFKAMIEANGGKLPEEMAARMRERGMDPDEILKQMGITPKAGGGEGMAAAAPAQPAAPIVSRAVFVRDEAYLTKRSQIDFASYADPDKLEDGEAKQQLRALQDKMLVAGEDYKLSKNRLDGQERLAEKKFITQNDLDLEVVKVQKGKIQVDSSETDKNLYVEYTFVKMAEKLLSDYEESLMNLERTMQEASAKLSQAASALATAEQKYNLEKNQLADMEEQLAKCVIRAERPGLVVYGSSSDSNPFRRQNEEPILEGTTVRERQKIITIPDMTKMGVKVSIHESAVQKIAPGQKVRMRIDAFPDRLLEGTVDRVSVLPDSANMFMNPDLKVYPTTLRIDGVFDWLRPGMSAQTEILITTVHDVVYVPIQAVSYHGDDQVVFVNRNGAVSRRVVTVGSFTEEFIEIKSGLAEGEEVLLLAPDAGKQDKLDKADGAAEKDSGGAAPAPKAA